MPTVEPSPRFTINVISADKAQDNFMHAADLFENFKRLGNNWSIEVECEDPQRYIDSLRDVIEKDGTQILTAIWCAQRPECCWIDWTIKAVSNGQQWFMLEPYLKQFGVTRLNKVVA